MEKVLCVWTGEYLNRDGSGNSMSCTDEFNLIGVLVNDLGGGGYVNDFLVVGEDGAEDEKPGTPSGFCFLARLASNSSFSFLIF